MNRSESSKAAILVMMGIIIVALYLAKEILIPISLALLLSFLLTPLVQQLQRFKIPHTISVFITAVFAFAVIAVLVWVIAHQTLSLAEDLSKYKAHFITRIHSLRILGSNLGKTKETVNELSNELSKTTHGSPVEQNATKVEVVKQPLSSLELMRAALEPLLAPLATAGIVVVFVIFMLLKREDLRDRLIKLTGPGSLHITTQALNDAAERVSRYLRMQLLINSLMGVAIGVGLTLIGVPNAILWGCIAAVLRFVPYIGSWIAAALPITLALGVFDTWTPVVLTFSLFVVLELTTAYVIEPWLYGSHTGVSSIALIVAAVFWTWLWGPVGLLLSTPLTVCLVVMGKYIPQLEFLDVMLGDEPVLGPGERFYQRLVATNPEEAEQIVHDQLEQSSFLAVSDTVFIPALIRARQDHEQAGLDTHRFERVLDYMREIVSDIQDKSDTTEERESAPFVLCLPAHETADEIASELFAHSLNEERISAGAERDALASELLNLVEKHSPAVICISALRPSAVIHSRYLCKRLRMKNSEIPIVVGLWNYDGTLEQATNRIMESGATKVVTSFAEAHQQISEMIQPLLIKQKEETREEVHGQRR